jgi:moderate conductance mechanosensitive channel
VTGAFAPLSLHRRRPRHLEDDAMSSFAALAGAQAVQSTPTLSIEPLVREANRLAADVLARPPQQIIISAALTLAIIFAAGLTLWLVRQMFDWAASGFSRKADKSEKPKRSAQARAAFGFIRFIVVIAALGGVLSVWGADPAALLAAIAGPFLDVAWRLALIVALAFVALEIATRAVTDLIDTAAERARGPRRAAQLRTVAPVLRATFAAIIIVIAGLTLLSELGVEVGPLLAGAGIVGLAVGFGAQTIVKDFITGVFLILEDIVSIGDVAIIQGQGGLVESMTLRTIRLRGYDGTLHVFPYGEAQIIQNMTKDFSFYVFDLSVAYSADIVKALDVMKQVGEEMAEDPAFKHLIMAPIEVVGVDKLADSGVVLKARFKTYPIQQWTVGREYLKRIKLAFDANGIEIPFPHIKLVAPDAPIPVGAPTPGTLA